MDPVSSADSVAGVDVGGTFTDVVVVGGGQPVAGKVPTTPGDQGEGVARGLALGGAVAGPVAHGTTTATNAVLERAVARTVLVTTEGFADVLRIARQERPSLYDLAVTRPPPLVPPELVVTVRERTAADGSVVVALTDEELARVVAAVAALAPESVAVSLLFGFAGPAHEQRLAAALERRLGPSVPVTRACVLAPEFREYERASTVVLNAAVAPVMGRYLGRLAGRLPGRPVTVMTSGGGTAALERAARAPVHTLLSGPAAGVVAAGRVAAAAGFPDAVAFDMGGTSTDVCLIRDGRPEVAGQGEIGGLPFRVPAVAIHTVGAGGGSIAWIDTGGALRVGPRSAGARPGPACYGLGGTAPTVTDAHAALGHLDPARPLGWTGADDSDAVHLDLAAAERVIGELPEGAEGVLTVVRAAMARALRRVTTERGVDPGGLALVAYGGAGPLSATALGREVGCQAVVVPPVPGVLSALGLLLAPVRHEVARTVLGAGDLDAHWEALAAQAAEELGRDPRTTTVRRLADVRYRGQSHELRVAAERAGDLPAALAAAHREAYGYDLPGEDLEVVTLRAVAEAPAPLADAPADWDLGPADPERSRVVGLAAGRREVRVLDRAALSPGDRVTGPALIEQPDTTTLLDEGDVAETDAAGNLVVRW